ncbi:hypothetical protein LINPERHAP1_LOCUS22087 [Linum perenne]
MRRTRMAISHAGPQFQIMVDSLERATIMCRDRVVLMMTWPTCFRPAWL